MLFFMIDFGCALQKEILLQGRCYISESYLCFNANIFGWVTNVSQIDGLIDAGDTNTRVFLLTRFLLFSWSLHLKISLTLKRNPLPSLFPTPFKFLQKTQRYLKKKSDATTTAAASFTK